MDATKPRRVSKFAGLIATTMAFMGTRAPNHELFENVHQVGGIRTATLDEPSAGGRPGCRVAMFNTGSLLRFTVALDRGGDIVEAFHGPCSLAFLTASDYKSPNPAYHHEFDWLSGWPGGLMTTCGPRAIGGPHAMPDGSRSSLHGTFSNSPGEVISIRNPDPRRGKLTMSLELLIRDARMFLPSLEIQRLITAQWGEAVIRICDTVTNTGNQSTPHHWLYHANMGYPLLDAGARVVLGGLLDHFLVFDGSDATPVDDRLNAMKQIPEPLREHRGTGERLIVLTPDTAANGLCRVGLINRARGLAVEIAFSREQLPRLGHWQHFGPAGSYVCGIEPFYGALVPAEHESVSANSFMLEPGEARMYELTIRVHDQATTIDAFAAADMPIRSRDASSTIQ